MKSVFHLCFKETDNRRTAPQLIRTHQFVGAKVELGYIHTTTKSYWAVRNPWPAKPPAPWRDQIVQREVSALLKAFRLPFSQELLDAVLAGMPPCELQARSVDMHGTSAPLVCCVRDGNVKASDIGRGSAVLHMPQKPSIEVVRDGQEVFRLCYRKVAEDFLRVKSLQEANMALRCYRLDAHFSWVCCSVSEGALSVTDALCDAYTALLKESFGLAEQGKDELHVATMSPRALWRAARERGTAGEVVCALTGRLAIAVGNDAVNTAPRGQVINFALRRAAIVQRRAGEEKVSRSVQ